MIIIFQAVHKHPSFLSTHTHTPRTLSFLMPLSLPLTRSLSHHVNSQPINNNYLFHWWVMLE